MATNRRRRFVYLQTSWMVGTILLFSLTNVLSLDLFFLVSLVGLLTVMLLTLPVNVRMRWYVRLRWFVVLGLCGVLYILWTKVVVQLGWG